MTNPFGIVCMILCNHKKSLCWIDKQSEVGILVFDRGCLVPKYMVFLFAFCLASLGGIVGFLHYDDF